jgi:hypothetical protein
MADGFAVPASKPVTELSYPIADIGPLDRDLLAAFNAAVWSAMTAYAVQSILAGCVNDQAEAAPIVSMVGALWKQANWCRDAVRKLANELNAVRSQPAKFGTALESNAHFAALRLSLDVRLNVFQAADPDKWLRSCARQELVGMDAGAIVAGYNGICQHFKTLTLPDARDIIAEVQLEAAKAQEKRNEREPAPHSLPTLAGPEPINFDVSDLAILNALASEMVLQTLYDLEPKTDLHRKTIAARLKRLRQAELVCQPQGKRKGWTITSAGRQRLPLDGAQTSR